MNYRYIMNSLVVSVVVMSSFVYGSESPKPTRDTIFFTQDSMPVHLIAYNKNAALILPVSTGEYYTFSCKNGELNKKNLQDSEDVPVATFERDVQQALSGNEKLIARMSDYHGPISQPHLVFFATTGDDKEVVEETVKIEEITSLNDEKLSKLFAPIITSENKAYTFHACLLQPCAGKQLKMDGSFASTSWLNMKVLSFVVLGGFVVFCLVNNKELLQNFLNQWRNVSLK